MNRFRSQTNALRRSLAFALSVVVLTVAAGCTVAPSPSGSAPSGSPSASGSSQFKTANDYYAQRVAWSTCGEFQCAAITVPIDWAHPAAGTTSVALTKHPAQNGKPIGSLLMNPGGPGASGVDNVQQYLDYFFSQRLIENYDIVGFDPRGVGKSTAVKCFDAAGMDKFLFELPGTNPGTPAYAAASRESLAGFGRACEDNTGALLGHVDSASVVRDMDVIRAVLGDSVLNYLGFSYGTKLGALYANEFPKRVGRMVLDGMDDPSLDNFETTLGQMKGFDTAFANYLAFCVSKAKSCPFSSNRDVAIAQLHTMLDNLQVSPLKASDGRMLGTNAMLLAIQVALYSKNSWPDLTNAITLAQQGEADAAYALVDAYYNRVDGKYEDNSTEAFYATNCLDYSHTFTARQIAAQQKAFRAASAVFGKYYADGTVFCDGWPIASTGKPVTVRAPGANPIMVIGATGDPATPYEWSKNVANDLDSGFLVTRVGDGHTSYSAAASSCIVGVVDDFLVAGTVPKADPRCS